jgi:hypothetical protein
MAEAYDDQGEMRSFLDSFGRLFVPDGQCKPDIFATSYGRVSERIGTPPTPPAPRPNYQSGRCTTSPGFWDTLKIAKIMREYGIATAQGSGRDHQIMPGNRLADRKQLRPQPGVDSGHT